MAWNWQNNGTVLLLNGKSPYDKLVMLKTVSTHPTTENSRR